MKIHFLGTCAGTEPMPDRKHASVAIEVNGKYYWFDAGDGCARTAYLMGLDLTKISKIFISHTHMDHIGGLANLLWYIRKIADVRGITPEDKALYIPNQEVADALFTILRNTEGAFYLDFDIKQFGVSEGLLFDDGVVKVIAQHNNHLAWRPEGGIRTGFNEEKIYRSFSYRIEAEGKSIIYSGDIKKPADIDALIEGGCDALIIETGHHGIDGVFEYVKDKDVKHVFFSHNGREILNHPEESKEKVDKYFGGRATICHDTMTVEL